MADNVFNAIHHGALAQIVRGAQEVEQPVLQCLQIKPLPSQNGAERYRVVMSDTVNFMQGMLSQSLNSIIHEDKLKKGSVCRLDQFQSNFVKDKHILVILEMDVLAEYGEPEKLGQPVPLESKAETKEDVKPQPGNIAGNNFYGNKPQQQQQQQQDQAQQQSLPSRTNGSYGGGGGGGGSRGGGAHANIYPIEALSPYAHKWTIKARCTQKGEIKTWHNKNGEGKLFSVHFLDDSGEIRATGFNDAVDQWYEVLQEGSVYYVTSPCRVNMAKKQFSNLNNDYELMFERDTLIEKAEDADGVPQANFNFTTLSDLQGVEKDTTIDCIGVLQDVGEVSEITSKATGKPYSKRELTLVDNTGFNVRLTIWGKTAESFETGPESVVAFKGVKVSDFGGRSLSLLSSGSMSIDPDIDEAHKLKGWYDGSGRTEQFQSHANTMAAMGGAAAGGARNDFKTIAQVREENIGMSDTTEWFSLKGTIIYIKQDSFAYPACRSEQPERCNKKVVQINPDEWRCEKCDKAWDAPDYRYVMSINVSDHTGQIWLSCFNDTGVQIMGMSANDLVRIKDEGDDRRVTEAFADANCTTFNFKCRAKMDTFQDQQRVRYQVQYANPLDFSREAKKLADLIKQYNIGSDSLFVN